MMSRSSIKVPRSVRPFMRLSVLIVCLLSIARAGADVIMMGQNGQPNIIENDDFEDVIMMPGMLINDNIIL